MYRLALLLLLSWFSCFCVAAQGDEKRVELKFTCRFAVEGYINHLRIKMAVPSDIPNRQFVEEAQFSTEPDSVYHSGGNTYVVFMLHNIDRDFKITFTSRLRIYRRIVMQGDTASEASFAPFLAEEPNIEVNAETICGRAAALRQ